MCGIALLLKRTETDCPAETLRRMRDAVTHRGPDDAGLCLFARDGAPLASHDAGESCWEVGLAHRRLSILDLSAAGHQPMRYRDGLWIVFNGEVYNFVELRAELERLGHAFRSHSDTEVVLAAFAQWGPDCFARFRGMWGLAIVDFARREAFLSRDRLGIKPIYFWQGPEIFAAASETKQFRHVPGFRAQLDEGVCVQYLQTGYEDSRRSFLQGVTPVPAGHWLRLSLDTRQLSAPEPYWHPERVAVAIRDPREAAEQFAAKLREAVRIHLRSDVPVGCALSGGLDSSAVALLIDQQRGRPETPFKTFTCTFPGSAVDEREYATAALSAVRAEPHFTTPSPDGFWEDLDRLVWVHDEPVGGVSIYGSYCLSRLTRAHGVPVTLNGQGGDEVLSGYWQSYFMYLRHLARGLRLASLTAHLAGAVLPHGNAGLVGQIPFMVRRLRNRRQGGSLLRLRNLRADPERNLLDRVLALDERAYRVNEIRELHLPRLLKWDDRNSMAFSVEGRYPFLDHELVELCLSFDTRVFYRRGWTKLPLRQAFAGQLPEKIAQRKTKFGFETPQEDWLCGPLRTRFQRWLREERPIWELSDRNDAERVAERVWRRDRLAVECGQMLFRLFMFDRWLEAFSIPVAAGALGTAA